MTTTRVTNVEMAAYWDGPDGDHWSAYADHYERVSWRHWQRLLDGVTVPHDARVLDVGCGTGGSTRALARIAADGAVLGIDLSSQMLRHAEQRSEAEGLGNVRFDQGDAQVYPFPRQAHDVAVSVFGAMFFEDPVAAFANIRASLKPGGTLALLTWRELSRNDWLVSMRHALAMGRDLPEPPASVPGPFGLADEEYVHRVLAAAGFGEVDVTEHEAPLEFGRDADDAYSFIGAMGLTKGLIHDLDNDAAERALGNVRQLVDDREGPEGVLFGSSAWLITATA